MGRYRKKPVVIDALQWDGGNGDEVLAFLADGHDDYAHLPGDGVHVGSGIGYSPLTREFDIPTLEGTMTARPGDWIIKEPFPDDHRRFYPCKPDIFEATYDRVES